MPGTAQAIIFWMATLPLAAEPPQSASNYVARGMQRFRDNDVIGSLRDFERATELDSRCGPHLWQRGISYYYQGEFKKARQQFESHQSVNPHDVENAAWHSICAAKIDGISKARTSLIKIDTARDTRIPLSVVYHFYAGHGPEESVLKAAARAGTELARMYVHPLLGLSH